MIQIKYIIKLIKKNNNKIKTVIIYSRIHNKIIGRISFHPNKFILKKLFYLIDKHVKSEDLCVYTFYY